ncbi:hypothetical protein EG328_008751 [Venturia inaequalis]|uniref:BTB domain-containing protein n=1 Tax=Venturia inaequalis TaxID=5025 RepID=A0A8H3V764_VENIN|nr:hypothetical protein EG328_008751 [Venturia inaequalis]
MAADTNNPQNKEWLARLYQSGQYADLTITCDGHTFTVHKSVICMQSSFFEKACKKDTFMEGATGVVDLPDDDPVAVKAMIEFLYLGSYSYDQETIQWSLHFKVATIADKYDINPLENFAYNVLEKAKSDLPDDNEFAAAAKWTYENTGVGGSGRKVIVEVAVRHLKDLLGSEAFSNVVGEVAEFGRDILIATQEVKEKTLNSSKAGYKCFACDWSWLSSDASKNSFVQETTSIMLKEMNASGNVQIARRKASLIRAQ